MLLGKLLEAGRAEGLRRITADVLTNRAMRHVLRRLGFHLRHDIEERVVKADLDLYQLA
ncbi:MAG: hypothetical protein JOZ19_10655 [Rubrobacter sp.]|nr:hypothetical protein [Rubrobacter sp.]